MEIYEPLPFILKCSLKEGIQPAIRSQLQFLWRGAHAVTSSASLAQSLGRKFMELGIKSGLYIPDQVKNRLCSYCSAILLPSITSTTRVQSRGKNSKIHKKKNLIPRWGDINIDSSTDNPTVFDPKIRRKVKNQVVSFTSCYIYWQSQKISTMPAVINVLSLTKRIFPLQCQITTCNLCSRVSSVVSGCEKTNKVPVVVTSATLPESKSILRDFDAIDNIIKTSGSSVSDRNIAKKFSFLQKNDRRSSAPGRMAEDFIPLNATESDGLATESSSRASSFFQKAKLAASARMNSNIAAADISTPLSADELARLGIVSTDVEETAPLSGQKRPMTLLELEEKNKKDKKARRKTMDLKGNTPNKRTAVVPKVGYEISTTGSGSTLSSLQNIFKLR